MSLTELLAKNQVIVCVGTGGVGKTTISAALGIRAARKGLKVLVLTLDPARRLATSLGIQLDREEDTLVSGQDFEGELYAAMIDPKRVFDGFIKRFAPDQNTAEKIMENHLYQQLSTVLSGSQEFTSVERLCESVQSKKYDLVILDTPPSAHAVDFLTAPKRIQNLFQESVARWFQGRTGSWITGVFNVGTRRTFQILEKLTGGAFIEDLFDFFTSIQGWQHLLHKRSQQVQDLLVHENTHFILVTSFDEGRLKESLQLRQELTDGKYNLRAVVINRFVPDWLEEHSEAPANGDLEELVKFYGQLKEYYKRREKRFELFQSEAGDKFEIVKVPDFSLDIHNLSSLRIFADNLDI